MVKQAVQFEMEPEQEEQGLEHSTQFPLVKNLEESIQLKQYVELWQLSQGEVQKSQSKVVVLAKVLLGQLAEQVPLYRYVDI